MDEDDKRNDIQFMNKADSSFLANNQIVIKNDCGLCIEYLLVL